MTPLQLHPPQDAVAVNRVDSAGPLPGKPTKLADWDARAKRAMVARVEEEEWAMALARHWVQLSAAKAYAWRDATLRAARGPHGIPFVRQLTAKQPKRVAFLLREARLRPAQLAAMDDPKLWSEPAPSPAVMLDVWQESLLRWPEEREHAPATLREIATDDYAGMLRVLDLPASNDGLVESWFPEADYQAQTVDRKSLDGSIEDLARAHGLMGSGRPTASEPLPPETMVALFEELSLLESADGDVDAPPRALRIAVSMLNASIARQVLERARVESASSRTRQLAETMLRYANRSPLDEALEGMGWPALPNHYQHPLIALDRSLEHLGVAVRANLVPVDEGVDWIELLNKCADTLPALRGWFFDEVEDETIFRCEGPSDAFVCERTEFRYTDAVFGLLNTVLAEIGSAHTFERLVCHRDLEAREDCLLATDPQQKAHLRSFGLLD